jgi:hypothetical protein
MPIFAVRRRNEPAGPQIYAIVDGSRRDAHRHSDGSFKCFPNSCNLAYEAKSFTDLRETAAFLTQNPDWGIRMQPGSSVIYEGIQIIRR